MGANCFNLAAAAIVNVSGASVAGASFVGGFALYAPYAIFKNNTPKYDTTMHEIIDALYVIGSAATGAALFGLAVQPFLVCATMGVAIRYTFSALFMDSGREGLQTDYSFQP